VGDYRGFVESFIKIRDPRIQDEVDRRLDEGLLWPEPLIQLNPAFELGRTVDKLTQDRVLHNECARIFRVRKSDTNTQGEQMRLFLHQEQAIVAAQTGANYVLTTGTGSGKSLAYIVPIVDTS